MPLLVERDDLEFERLALVDDIARMVDALMGQLAYMDQAFEPVAYTDERAEVDDLGDLTIDDVANRQVGDRGVPQPGSGWSRRIDREMRPRSWLMSMTSASTSSPTR